MKIDVPTGTTLKKATIPHRLQGQPITGWTFVFKAPIDFARADKLVEDYRQEWIKKYGTNFNMTVSVLNDYKWMPMTGIQPVVNKYPMARLYEKYEDNEYLKQTYVDKIYQVAIFMIIRKPGGKDLHNDCLFNAIGSALRFNKLMLPECIRYPADFKKYLRVGREDPVPPECIQKLDMLLGSKKFGVRLNCTGEYEYTSPNETKFVINLLLQDGHYSSIYHKRPELNYQKKYTAADPKTIGSYKFTDEKDKCLVCYFNGDTKTICREEFNELRKTEHLVKCPDDCEPSEYVKMWHDNGLKLLEASKGQVNLFKSTSISKAALGIWHEIVGKFYAGSEDIDIAENRFILGAFVGGLQYSKQYEGPGYQIDVNGFYPSVLQTDKFELPVGKSVFETITTDRPINTLV